jgi:acyl carrier protein
MKTDQIETNIQDHFQSTKGQRPGKEDNLFDMGLLDSFGVIEFLTYLETQFNLQMNLEEITAENFSTVSSVSRLISKNLEG